MQVITTVHGCLYFKLNKQKYLFGVSHTLSLDQSALKRLTPDHVIFPSRPYLLEISTFLWNFQSLPFLSHSLVVPDSATRKRVESLLQEEGKHSLPWRWDLFKNHLIDEEGLIKVMVEQGIPDPLAREPWGFGFNDSLDKLSVIVPEKGCSVLLIHGCDIVVVDPSERIEQLLFSYGLPLTALKGVLLTNSDNLNWFECLLKLPTILLIIQQDSYFQVANKFKTIFFWEDQMLKRRVKARIVRTADKWHRIGPLEYSYSKNSEGQVDFWDIKFGLKRLRLVSQTLNRFPSEIIDHSDLQYLITSEMSPQTKKQLEKSPEAYRKKVVYNRVDRKYNNKYFVSLSQQESLLLIMAHPHLQNRLFTPPVELSFRFRNNDPNRRLLQKHLANGEEFNAAERAVYVRRGYIQTLGSDLFGQNSQLENAVSVRGVGRSSIMFQALANIYFFHGQDMNEEGHFDLSESLLSKVKDNSFVGALNRRTEKGVLETNSDDYLKGSQWDLVNRVCQMKTFEADFEGVDWLNCLYIVIKGALKFKGREQVASKNMGIGNIRRFYCSAYQQQDEIQVLKDTWALQLPIRDLQVSFFGLHPDKMYELLTKQLIFF